MKPTRYTIGKYGEMIACEPRTCAYAEALRRAVTPGCTVIDLGAGPGFFSVLACRYGAGSVIAIEPDESVELLRQFAADNDCLDRITIFKGLSTEYSPPKSADVIISDLHGALPLFEGHIPTIVDARDRLLSPGGTLIPQREKLRIAVVQSQKYYKASEEPWLRNKFGIDLSSAHRFASNSWSLVNLAPTDLLSETRDLAVLDYAEISDPDLTAEVELNVTKAGTAHGLLIWFDTELAPEIGFSNAPGEPPQIYGQTFFPFEAAVEVNQGDRIGAGIRANLIDGSYVWGWNTSFLRKGDTKPEVAYRQSTILSKVISRESLRTRASNFAPPVLEWHEVDRVCLSLIDGQRTLAEIAEAIRAEFPDRFTSPAESLNHVTQLANRYR